MRLTFAMPLLLAAVLSGCAGSPAAEPAGTTSAAKTTAQVASAVAKTRPQLEEAMDRFDDRRCRAVMVWHTLDESGIKLCASYLTDVADHSRVMQKDLEEAKPWSDETRAVAEETVAKLGKMVDASNYEHGKSMDVTTTPMESLRSQLQAWKPFGA